MKSLKEEEKETFCTESGGSCPKGPSAQLLHVFPEKVQHCHHHHHHPHHHPNHKHHLHRHHHPHHEHDYHPHHEKLTIILIMSMTIIPIINMTIILIRYPGLAGQAPGPPSTSSPSSTSWPSSSQSST